MCPLWMMVFIFKIVFQMIRPNVRNQAQAQTLDGWAGDGDRSGHWPAGRAHGHTGQGCGGGDRSRCRLAGQAHGQAGQGRGDGDRSRCRPAGQAHGRAGQGRGDGDRSRCRLAGQARGQAGQGRGDGDQPGCGVAGPGTEGLWGLAWGLGPWAGWAETGRALQAQTAWKQF